jgi:cell division protein FtsA
MKAEDSIMLREKYYCGLDLGSRKLKAGVLKIRDAGHVELLGIYEKDTAGFREASVTDLGEFSDCVHATVNTLLQKTGVKIKEVHLGVGCDLVEIREAGTVVPLIDRGTKIITRRDTKRVNDQARLLSLQVDEEVLHDLPQYYVVDDLNKALDPGGLYGRKLGVHSLLVIANANRIRNIVRAVHQAGYDVPHVFFSSYAACEAALGAAERAEGRVLVDVGSKATSILIVKDDVLRYLKKIDAGGDHFTHSIVEALNLPFDLAEEIKKSYATVLSSDEAMEEEILVKRESVYKPIKRREICAAVAPQAQRFLGALQQALGESGLMEQIDHGIVMTGGGSLLTGLIERVGQAVNRPVRLAKLNVTSQKSLGNAALFSAVVGLAQKGFRQSLRYAVAPDGDWRENLVSRFRELYHEYF